MKTTTTTNRATKTLTLSAVKKVLSRTPKATRKAVCCALIGHSRMSTFCFGYRHCGRCDAQVGDSLGSVDPGAETAVIKGHGCKTCKTNAKELTWRDTLLMPTVTQWFKRDR